MEILLFSFLLFFFFLSPAGACQSHCPADGQNDVHFPFHIINGSFSNDRCGFGPGFGVTCNGQYSKPVLNLPKAGDFVVDSIDYGTQTIHIKDPKNCIPKRLLNFSLSDSPFHFPKAQQRYISLLSCHVDNSTESLSLKRNPFWSDACFNETNNVILAAFDDMKIPGDFQSQCQEIKRVPVSFSYPPPYYEEFKGWSLDLTWDNPDCGSCEEGGGICGYKGDTGSEIGCSNLSNSTTTTSGFPRSAKYGLIIGVGIPGLLCLIGLSCFTCGWIRTYSERRRLSGTDFAISIGPQPAMISKGLDGPTIESYPKTVLGESRRLPKPNDCTCPICLSEYQSMDTIRTIPECNHCFHVHCVDEWLKMNATCPVCRNSPPESSAATPCSSVSSSTLLSSSPSSASATSVP